MLTELMKLANESQGVASWAMVLLISIGWVKLNGRIDSVKEYIRLRIKLVEQEVKIAHDKIEELRK